MIHRRLLLAGAAALLVGLAAATALAVMSGCGPEGRPQCWRSDGGYAIALVTAILGLTSGGIATGFGVLLRRARGPLIGRRAQLRVWASGRRAVAQVDAVSPTLLMTNGLRWTVLTLQVHPDDGSARYETTVTTAVPFWMVPKQGNFYVAAIDSVDRRRVVLLLHPTWDLRADQQRWWW